MWVNQLDEREDVSASSIMGEVNQIGWQRMKCLLIHQRPVATMEIQHCRTLINNNNKLFSLVIYNIYITTTNDHHPIPHILNKTSILDGMIIHAINATSIKSVTQSLAHMMRNSPAHFFDHLCVKSDLGVYWISSSPYMLSRSNLIVVSNRTA
jgi:hypothetical protein